MTAIITKAENKTDWEAKGLLGTSPLPTTSKSAQSAGKWTTRWHGLDDEKGVLIEQGNVKVALYSDQWVVYHRPSAEERWKPFSYHLQCDSLLRMLRERKNHKETTNPWDYEATCSALSAMTNERAGSSYYFSEEAPEGDL